MWTEDRRILFVGPEGLYQVAESGGAPTLLTKVDVSLGEILHLYPQLLPGGRLLYLADNAKAENSAIYVAPLSDPSKRVLVTHSTGLVLYAPGGDGKDYLLTQNGQALVAREFDIRKLTLAGSPRTVVSQLGSSPIPAAVSRGGILMYAGGMTTSRFTWLDRAGKTLEVVSEPDHYPAFRLSPDGKHFVAVRGNVPVTDLWLMTMERHVFSMFSPTSRSYSSAVWSNDGRTVLFGQQGIVLRKDITASGEGERIADWKVRRLSDWSRDGRFLLYETVDPETKRDLWVAPMTPGGQPVAGTQPQPYLRGAYSEWHGRFSPELNPRWVAYESDETGRSEICLASFPDARRRLQVTAGGGAFPEWGPDGRELFYVSGDRMLTVVGLKNGAEGLEPSSPQQLFPLAANNSYDFPYQVSPDGKRILVNQPGQDLELHVVVNWPLLLRRQADQ